MDDVGINELAMTGSGAESMIINREKILATIRMKE